MGGEVDVRAAVLFWGTERTTFVVGPDGRVLEVLRRVRPARHDELALAALGAPERPT